MLMLWQYDSTEWARCYQVFVIVTIYGINKILFVKMKTLFKKKMFVKEVIHDDILAKCIVDYYILW